MMDVFTYIREIFIVIAIVIAVIQMVTWIFRSIPCLEACCRQVFCEPCLKCFENINFQKVNDEEEDRNIEEV
uniref:LITAF domain-containing protein n=1 Tax=Parastrongyloides trichosuri TaxID=131310 RepID=A0A0N4Z5R4_PARTI